MERTVSDLLDEIMDDQVELSEKTPLDKRRIRRMTMERFRTKRTVRFRWMGKVAAVAAVLMAMTATVFAADAVLGEGKLLGQFFGKELSQEQLEVADDIGRDFGGSLHINGTTITPLEAIADEDNMYLHLRVEAPEGVVLRDLDEEAGYFYDFQPSYVLTEGTTRWNYDPSSWNLRVEYYWDNGFGNWHTMSCTHTVKTLEDEDPTDNVKEFVIRFHSTDGYAIFNGPWEKYIHFSGLFIRQKHEDYCEEVLRGRFTFDIGINDEDRKDMKLVVDASNVTIRNKEHGYTVELEEIIITPLSITVKYTNTDPDDQYIFPKGGPIQLVMKDGTVIDAVDDHYDATEYPRPDDVLGVSNYSCFDELIVLSQIDYILVDGDQIIEINQEAS